MLFIYTCFIGVETYAYKNRKSYNALFHIKKAAINQ